MKNDLNESDSQSNDDDNDSGSDMKDFIAPDDEEFSEDENFSYAALDQEPTFHQEHAGKLCEM